MIFPKVPDDLKLLIRSSDAALKQWTQENFPRGQVLKWKAGKYIGRECRIVKAIIINEPDGQMTVGLRVETRRERGGGFINGNDDFHRTYHDAHYFFERSAENQE